MAWSDPKIDWAGTDYVDGSAFNRIEGNLLATQFALSGCVGGSGRTFPSDDAYVQTIRVDVPNGQKITLHRVLYFLTDTTLQFRVYALGADLWTSSINVGDDSPETVLYTNSTGSSQAIEVFAMIHRTAGTVSLAAHSGWHVNFSVGV